MGIKIIILYSRTQINKWTWERGLWKTQNSKVLEPQGPAGDSVTFQDLVSSSPALLALFPSCDLPGGLGRSEKRFLGRAVTLTRVWVKRDPLSLGDRGSWSRLRHPRTGPCRVGRSPGAGRFGAARYSPAVPGGGRTVRDEPWEAKRFPDTFYRGAWLRLPTVAVRFVNSEPPAGRGLRAERPGPERPGPAPAVAPGVPRLRPLTLCLSQWEACGQPAIQQAHQLRLCNGVYSPCVSVSRLGILSVFPPFPYYHVCNDDL